MINFTALRAAFFRNIQKTSAGGGRRIPSPPTVCGLSLHLFALPSVVQNLFHENNMQYAVKHPVVFNDVLLYMPLLWTFDYVDLTDGDIKQLHTYTDEMNITYYH